MVKTILYGICMGYYLYGICIGNCGNFFPWNRSNAATSHTSPIQKANFSWTLKPYISAPASRRMMPLVPNESTTQELSFELPLTCAEGRWKVENSIFKMWYRNANLLRNFSAKYCNPCNCNHLSPTTDFWAKKVPNLADFAWNVCDISQVKF